MKPALGMLANVDLLLSGAAAIAVCSYQSWRIASIDMLLLFSAIAVYALLSQYFKLRKPTSCSCQESIVDPQQEVQCEDALEAKVRQEIAMMNQCASQRDVAGTMRIFRALQQQGVRMSSAMYNAVMDAWINCGNVQAAEDWMDDVRDAGMADLVSFNTLIKALVKTRALDKAHALLEQMREADIQPDIATFNELLSGCAHENRLHAGLCLLEQIDKGGIRPSSITLDGIVNLLNGCRGQDESSDRVCRILRKFKLQPNSFGNWSGSPHLSDQTICCAESCSIADSSTLVPMPRLVAVISRTEEAERTSSLCQHEIQITGTLARVKAVQRTLKQHGFLNKAEGDDTWPLNGHWETDHGLTVVIEGKLVRWSRQRASRLRLVGDDRRSCVLPLYGSATTGRLVTEGQTGDAAKTLMWDNGDVWHSYDGRVIGQAALFSQTMTKVLRDDMQDQAYRARSDAVLRCISRNSLCLPTTVENTMIQFLGNDLYFVRVCFESTWNPQLTDVDDSCADPFDLTSRRNPRVGFRHCWAEPDKGYGQRTLVNGEEVDEESFNRHVKFVVKKTC